MRTEISISGQIGGNHTLVSRLLKVGNKIVAVKEGPFYGQRIIFETKRAAKQALWMAYKSLCADEPEMRGNIGGIRYSPGIALYYDASKAVISEN